MIKKYVVAIDLGASNLRAALVDIERPELLKKISEKTLVSEGPEKISEQVVNIVKKLLAQTKVSLNKVIGIGVGAPGPLDLRKGGIARAVNIPYDFVPIREPLEESFRIHAALMNDANAAALGEWMFGAGRTKKVNTLVFITISTGIGGGIVEDGRLLMGADGNAGEVGCLLIDYRGKLRCGCGRYGHWQAYSSGAGIPNYVKYLVESRELTIKENSLLFKTSNNLRKLSAKILYECAKKGDADALKIVENLAIINAAGVGQVINAYNPDIITLGGSIVLNNVELTIDKMMPYVKNYASNRIPEILPTPLGEDIVLYGAAAVLLKEVEENERKFSK